MSRPSVRFEDLGRMGYQEAWDYQEKLLKVGVDQKLQNRKQKDQPDIVPQNHLLFVEHPPVYTLGKSGSMDNLLLNEVQMEEEGIEFYKINRGGDITFHGPGQLVGYPILDLDQFKPDLHLYLRNIEEATIETLKEYDIEAGRIDGLTGVWIDMEGDDPRKILAIGVRCSRWITMHGFAFNINTNLDYFGHIIPCGIDDKGVTSLAKELGRPIDMAEVHEKMKRHLAGLFGFDFL